MSTTNDYMNKVIRQRDSNLGYDNVIFRWKDGRIIPIKTKEYTFYHSSSSDFDNFDDQYIGKCSRGGLAYGKGHYFLDTEGDLYGRHGYKVKVSLKNPFIVQESKWSATLEKMGYDWWDFQRPDPSDFLASKGYDATILKNEEGNTVEAIIYTNKDKKIKIIEKTLNGKKIND